MWKQDVEPFCLKNIDRLHFGPLIIFIFSTNRIWLVFENWSCYLAGNGINIVTIGYQAKKHGITCTGRRQPLLDKSFLYHRGKIFDSSVMDRGFSNDSFDVYGSAVWPHSDSFWIFGNRPQAHRKSFERRIPNLSLCRFGWEPSKRLDMFLSEWWIRGQKGHSDTFL